MLMGRSQMGLDALVELGLFAFDPFAFGLVALVHVVLGLDALGSVVLEREALGLAGHNPVGVGLVVKQSIWLAGKVSMPSMVAPAGFWLL